MEPPLSESLILWVLFIMGAVLIAMVGRSTGWFRQWGTPTEEDRRERFQLKMSDRLGAALRSAEADKAIMDEWEDCPLEYRPYLWEVIRHSQILEEAMIEEAQRRGVYPRRVVTQGQEIPPPPQPHMLPPKPQQEGASPPSAVRPKNDNVITLPSAQWINGQLVRSG